MGRPADIVGRMYDAFVGGRWEEHISLFDPDLVVDFSRSGIPDVAIYRGRDGLREGWRRWRTEFAIYLDREAGRRDAGF
jgi:SnoaL-like domain